ncbi:MULTISPECIES: AzlC family ABC transporter permease [Metabacillus]|uniref:AzlC family ABC transporter permease n=1 Tax=Metabacillus endolithicus TaxID=1535204 RepID=A0ABW5C5N3_9BACI|nr:MULTISPECIES: AzlC family ABC transporter permease [Metabacillus]MCM3411272.1 AzlC family ABC transporter permease [Metabacillus litoralis]UHA60339.1 AzlC family ABC transporter permease [Metabacillus litoralis]UPG62319.1 AzlC family ABC transporter permease [Metabacillus endolithicus]
MSTTTLAKKQSDFLQGTQGGISIAIGYLPVALTFGLLSKSTGLSLSETVLMSLIVFAGASQYICLSLLAVGTGIIEIIFTTFIVNIRHFLMSASLSEKVENDSLWKKALYSFGLTDETFTVASTRDGNVNAGYLFGLMLISYASWVINSGIGYVIGASLPTTVQESMGIALYAMFIGLLIPSLKKHRKVMYLAVVAAILNSLCYASQMISTGWAIVLSTLLSAIIVEFFYSKQTNEVEQRG